MSYFRVNDKCNGCLACVENCPASALRFEDTDNKRTLSHNMTLCARCGQCWRICPQKAVEFQHLLVGNWDPVVTMDIVCCKICGEPLFTVDFNNTLHRKLENSPDPLCPKHRRSGSVGVWPRLGPGKRKPERKTK